MAKEKTSNADLFAIAPRPSTPARIGIGGWTYAPWRNNFYPAGLIQKRELEYASRQLTAIEVNGTFYGAQKPAVYASWRAQAPDGFLFSLKAPKRIVESRQLAGSKGQVEAFVHGGLAELGDRLGPILWQLAPHRAFAADDLAAFLDLLPRELDGRRLRHVLEVRHDSFRSAAYLELMRRHGLPTVFTDSPDYPSFADITGDFVYARLMRSRSDLATGYSESALEAWAAHTRIWLAGGAPDDLPYVQPDLRPAAVPRDTFVYFISSAKERNPAAATSLLRRLEPANR